MLNSKVYTKKCVICGKEYKSISVRALTCGKQCRNEYHRRNIEKREVLKRAITIASVKFWKRHVKPE